MNIKPINNHVELAFSRLVEQDKESRNILVFQGALVKKWQELEDLMWVLSEQRNIITITGRSLDLIGDIVDEPRNFQGDEEYRIAILRKIVQNNCGGTPEEIITLISFIVPPSSIRIFELAYATFIIEITADISINLAKLIKATISIAKPVAVTFAGVIIIPESNAFTMDNIQNIQYDYLVNSNISLAINANDDTLAVINLKNFQGSGINLPGLAERDFLLSNLETDDNKLYLVDDSVELLLSKMNSSQDYIDIGGGYLAELII